MQKLNRKLLTPDSLGEEIQAQAIKFANQLFNATKTPYSLLIPGGAPNMIPGIG